MFPSGSIGSGGGLERSQSSRGAAHPFLEAAPPPTGPPIFSSYAVRQNGGNESTLEDRNNNNNSGAAAADRDKDDDSISGGVVPFREEDRMFLRLLYHQQQAIQVQLNTMTEWMQQVNYRIAAVERLIRTSRSTLSATVPHAGGAAAGGSLSYSAQPPSRSTSVVESYAAVSNPHIVASHPPPTSSPQQVTIEAPHARLPPGQGSTYIGQSHPVSSSPALSSVLESSRACTPPSEQTRHHVSDVCAASSSAVPSTTRSYESALAAPWDPHNASQQPNGVAVHSRTSSHTSALGRRANPLLNSSGVKSTLQIPATTSRSSLADSRQQLSRLETSGLSGTGTQGPSSSMTGVSAEGAPTLSGQSRRPPIVSPPTTASLAAADAINAVPPYRRVAAEFVTAATMARQPLSRIPAVTRHAPPTSTLADTADKPSGRERTLPPPPPHSAATSSSLQDSTQNPSVEVDKKAKEHAGEGAAAPPAGLPTVHRDPTGNRGGEEEAFPGRAGVQRKVAADDDSLSDGYGSYESRMYMKNLGLL